MTEIAKQLGDEEAHHSAGPVNEKAAPEAQETPVAPVTSIGDDEVEHTDAKV